MPPFFAPFLPFFAAEVMPFAAAFSLVSPNETSLLTAFLPNFPGTFEFFIRELERDAEDLESARE